MARKTKDAVIAGFAGLDGFVSAQELHAQIVRNGDRVGLTTVYRHVRLLQERGEVDFVRDESGEGRFRYCGTGHHHHLICTACGRTVEVASDEMEAWVQKLARTSGFRQLHHSVELRGVCARCPAS